MVLNRFYVSRFSDLDSGTRLHTPRKHGVQTALAVFMATTQLLVNYSHTKETRRKLYRSERVY